MGREASEQRQRILFVDDDPNVVEGLRRMLRPYRDQWDMSFSTNPVEALELIKSQPFDIVIADMRMPKLTGAELLREVQNIAPRTVRIILSGHSEVSAIVQSVGPSHQFLAKPCDPKELEERIRHALQLRQYVSDPRILDVVGGIDTIPSIPAIYQQVVTAIQKNRPLGEIGALVAQDMGMTTRLLQLVNSSYFGLARKTEDPARAVLMLGVETLQALVLGSKIFDQFPAEKEAQLAELWSESSRVAGIAAKLCALEEADSVVTGQAMVASFLRAVGLVALAARAPELFDRIHPLQQSCDPAGIETAEREAIGATHTQIGGCLLGMWNVPDAIVDAVAFHRCPSLSPRPTYGPLTILHVAHAFAKHPPTSADPAVLAAAGLDAAYLTSIGRLERVPIWIETLGPIAAS